MLRLSESVISSLALSTPRVRLRFTGKYGNLEAIMAFQEKTGSATGQAMIDGKIYYIEPTTEDERNTEPCFKKEQSAFMGLFHKLISMEDAKPGGGRNLDLAALPPSLVSPLQGVPASACCEGSVPGVCARVMVNDTLLHQQKKEVMVPLPWRTPDLHSDTLEFFTLASTMPSSCVGQCDIYNYGGSDGLKVRAVLDGFDAIISITREGLKFSVKQCDDDSGYVLTAAMVATSTKDKKSIPLTAGGDTIAAGRTVELGCEYQNMYCNHNPDAYVLDEKKNCEYGDCRQFCADTHGCKHFTWYKSRGGATCYAMDTCDEERNAACLTAGACKSGPVSCDNTTTVVTGCEPPSQLGPEYIPWQCNGPQGNVLTAAEMSETLPVGSSCYLRCDSWKTASGSQGYLESTCDSDGEWTATVPHNDDDELKTPGGPYPLPTYNETDMPAPLMCACSPLHITWPPEAMDGDEDSYFYDPNDEEGTDFVCKIPPTEVNSTYVVQEDNDCIMYCDSHLTTAVKCNDGVWTGEPELGFWCYSEPLADNPSTANPSTSTDQTPTETTSEGNYEPNWISYGGTDYAVGGELVSRDDAAAFCSDIGNGTSLAKIEDNKQNNFLAENGFDDKGKDLWFGLKASSKSANYLSWDDGEEHYYKYHNFERAYPGAHGTIKIDATCGCQCAFIKAGTYFQWDYGVCSEKKLPLCMKVNF